MSSPGPLTPADDQYADADHDQPHNNEQPTAPVIDYSPASVPYNEAFENALMKAILYPSNQNPTTRPRSPTSHSPSRSPAPPNIPPTTLPVPLDSPLRIHASPIPGVLLTHPNGHITGGPGPSPAAVAAFAEGFVSEHGIQDAGQLERVVEEKVEELMEVVRERMGEREEVVRRNGEVRRQLEELEAQRVREVRVHEKIKEERERKKAGG